MQQRSSRKSGPAAAPSPARGRAWRPLASLAVLAVLLIAPLSSHARSDYDPKRAGNPLRIVYYVAYPATLLLDWVIFRPAYYIGQCEPFHTIFGTERPLESVERETAVEPDPEG